MDDAFESFAKRMKDRFEEKREKNLEMLSEDPVLHLENRLYDKVIVYMGDKEIERDGDPEDLVEMANLAMLIWWKKSQDEVRGP